MSLHAADVVTTLVIMSIVKRSSIKRLVHVKGCHRIVESYSVSVLLGFVLVYNLKPLFVVHLEFPLSDLGRPSFVTLYNNIDAQVSCALDILVHVLLRHGK